MKMQLVTDHLEIKKLIPNSIVTDADGDLWLVAENGLVHVGKPSNSGTGRLTVYVEEEIEDAKSQFGPFMKYIGQLILEN